MAATAGPINGARPMAPLDSRSPPFDDHHRRGPMGSSKPSHERSPLPIPSSRAPTATERPRTSGGPESRKPKGRTDFGSHQLRTRDDTFVADMVAKGTATRSYHIPIWGKAPSPDSSPDSRGHSPPTTTIVRTTTPDSFQEPEDTGLVTIGMALGSPNHPHGAAAPAWRPQQFPRAMTASAVAPAETPTKSKGRKWGIFGRSKSTKRGRSVTNSAGSPPSTTQEQFSNMSSPQAGFMRQDSPQIVASPVKKKPLVTRAYTAPLIGEAPVSRKVNAGGSSYQTSQNARKPLPVHPGLEDQGPPPPAKENPKGQLLNVDIPSIEMERYSIMFGSVLQSKSGSSSLLARRQATLEKLRMLRDETTREEEEEESPAQGGLSPLQPPARRATSPVPGRQSPSFSLFPPTPGKVGTPQNPSPRGRSNTSPAFLPSPSRPFFSPQEAEIFLQRSGSPFGARKSKYKTAVTTPDASERESPREGVRAEKPRSATKFRSPRVLVDSPASITEDPATSDINESLRDSSQSKHMASETSLASSHTRSQSSMSTATSSTKAGAAMDDEATKALRDAVENSIRRQISMSQQQRSMLRPQHLKASPIARGKDASPQGVGINKNIVPRSMVGKNDRLAETKTSTPTLVVPGSEGQSLMSNRKSERIVLDNA